MIVYSNFRHISLKKDTPEYKAKRKPCRDFDKFNPFFKQCHYDLEEGRSRLADFTREQSIKKGDLFLLNGVLTYIAEKGKAICSPKRTNFRLRCIFENGTESDMLLRSLAVALYRQGKRVIRETNVPATISSENHFSGFIYILKSNSTQDEIKSIKNLYKIGYSTTSVERRIKNSEKSPTYLMSEVFIIQTFKCYNLNIKSLEYHIHRLFEKSCLDIEVRDAQGKIYRPREWFIIPLNIVEQAIKLFIEGSIKQYVYDSKSQKIKKRI